MAQPLLTKWFPWVARPAILNGPMFGTAFHNMATGVTKAGGLGMIGGGFDFSPESKQIVQLDSELSKAAELLSIKQGSVLPVGVGFITFLKSVIQLPDTVGPILAKWKVATVWLFAPEPSGPPAHAAIIPALKDLGKSWGLKIIVQVGSVEAARQAVKNGADIIVAQGVDAGGHQWAHGAGVISLVPEVHDMLRSEFKEREIALLGAGGIMDGRGVAAVMALGADGAVMGTRVRSKRTMGSYG
jgi:nitronate monooxygenase